MRLSGSTLGCEFETLQMQLHCQIPRNYLCLKRKNNEEEEEEKEEEETANMSKEACHSAPSSHQANTGFACAALQTC